MEESWAHKEFSKGFMKVFINTLILQHEIH